MSVRLAYMSPATSQRSGRRYFRGRDKHGHQFWLMEVANSRGKQWVLSVDLTGSTAEPERLAIAGREDIAKMLTGPAPSATLIERT